MGEKSDIAGIPGKIIKEVIIPAREYLAIEVKKGQIFRFIDIEGQQVVDLTVFNLNDSKERSSCNATRHLNDIWHITEGNSVYSTKCNKMYTIIDDKVGQNVYNGGFCTEELNYVRYGVRGTRNCRDNLIMAVAPYGLGRKDIQEDGNCGLMMNIELTPGGKCVIREPVKEPGRYADLLAEMDLLVAISNCPSERNPCNAFNPTPVKVIVYERS